MKFRVAGNGNPWKQKQKCQGDTDLAFVHHEPWVIGIRPAQDQSRLDEERMGIQRKATYSQKDWWKRPLVLIEDLSAASSGWGELYWVN